MAIDVPENVVVADLNNLASWCRKNSLWPMPFATACCGIELSVLFGLIVGASLGLTGGGGSLLAVPMLV